MRYRCIECHEEFSKDTFEERNGFCPNCENFLEPKEEVEIGVLSVPSVRGECGLGILVLDFSSSMSERAFIEEKHREYPQKKIDLVSHALGYALPRMSNISKSENAYVAIIGFAHDAKLLEVIKASEIEKDADYWIKWTVMKQKEILSDFGDGTNISRALEVAWDIYDSALRGNIEEYQHELKNFALMYHDVNVANEIRPVANVRTFLYSDGEHNTGQFRDHFQNASLIPGRSNINGLITAYFGSPNTEGYRLLEGITGVCPIHSVKGVIYINSPETYPFLRRMFHMASAASGFCAECAKELVI